MKPIVRVVLVGLLAGLGVIAVAEESWAVFAGGSRLMFYYTQRSLVNSGAGPGSAATIIGITNQNSSSAVNVRVNIFNGSTCAGFGPVQFNIGARRTLRINIGEQVLAGVFPEGWVDVYAVTAGGSPIQWDQLSGKGTILDFGGSNTSVATYEAAALFSDDANRATSGAQGALITNNSNGNTFGALGGQVEFWAPGGPFNTNHRLVVIPVSTTPGTAPVASNYSFVWTRASDGTETRNAPVGFTCMLASSLADLHPGFAANYPNTVSLADGGNINISNDGTNKGFVGALFETAPNPALLVVHSIQQSVGPTMESHE
jgi:hypothetical protein